MRSIVELIKAAGGPRQIAAATHGTPREITLDAVHKWKKKGIPHWHWPVLMRLTDATESEILAANQALLPDPRRSKGSRGGHRRKPRAKRVLAQAAA